MTVHTGPDGNLWDDATAPPTPLRQLGLRRNYSLLAFNAAPVVDMVLADVFLMVLTGNTIPGAPIWGAAAIGATHIGMELEFHWIQDAVGGRTITYSNAVWAVTGAAAITTTLNTRTIDKFEWDSVHWRLISRITAQT